MLINLMTHAELLVDDPRRSPLNTDAHVGQRPMNPDPQNQITPQLSSTSISAATLQCEVDFVPNGVWALKFPTDKPWRGGAQTVK